MRAFPRWHARHRAPQVRFGRSPFSKAVWHGKRMRISSPVQFITFLRSQDGLQATDLPRPEQRCAGVLQQASVRCAALLLAPLEMPMLLARLLHWACLGAHSTHGATNEHPQI